MSEGPDSGTLDRWREDAKRLERPGANGGGGMPIGGYEASQRMLWLIATVTALRDKLRSYEREATALVANLLESGNLRATAERERDALQVQLNRYALAIETNESRLAELKSERQRREQVERAWATELLHRPERSCERVIEDGLVWDAVVALIREHAGKPIGECERCKQRAPLVYETFTECGLKDSWLVCAWGCAEGKTEPDLHELPASRTNAEQAVLEAMGAIDIGILEAIRNRWSAAPLEFHPPCLAELARREAAK